MSLKTRGELTHVTHSQYQKATPAAKAPILDAFIAATGYHRKYALTLLNLPLSPHSATTKPRKPEPVFLPGQSQRVVASTINLLKRPCFSSGKPAIICAANGLSLSFPNFSLP